MVLKVENFGKSFRNTWKALKGGVWRMEKKPGPIV
jgi:hypothetical protein